jgi:glucan endo-1,3-alpha-glucosidase
MHLPLTNPSCRPLAAADIGPLEGSQPGSEAWTESMPHDALLALTAHYIRRLKSAHPSRPLGPAQTGAEHLVLWYRPHSADLRTVGSDAVGRPANTAWAADTISYFAHLAEPATLVVCATGRDGAAVQRSVDLPAGEYASALPFAPGLQSFRLVRRGRVVAALEGREILAEGECAAWNFNLWSGQVRF